MGQQEVSDFLKKNVKQWFTSKEIAKNLKVSHRFRYKQPVQTEKIKTGAV